MPLPLSYFQKFEFLIGEFINQSIVHSSAIGYKEGLVIGKDLRVLLQELGEQLDIGAFGHEQRISISVLFLLIPGGGPNDTRSEIDHCHSGGREVKTQSRPRKRHTITA